MGVYAIRVGGGRSRQSHRRYRQGYGPIMQKFKRLIKKGYQLGKKHLAPHLKKIGQSVLTDVLEGRNLGQSLKTYARRLPLILYTDKEGDDDDDDVKKINMPRTTYEEESSNDYNSSSEDATYSFHRRK